MREATVGLSPTRDTAAAAARLVADWPPLTDAQRERLGVLLRGSDSSRTTSVAGDEAA